MRRYSQPTLIDTFRRDLDAWKEALPDSARAPTPALSMEDKSGVLSGSYAASEVKSLRVATYGTSYGDGSESISPEVSPAIFSGRRGSGGEGRIKRASRHKLMEWRERERQRPERAHSHIVRARKQPRPDTRPSRARNQTYIIKFYETLEQLEKADAYRRDLGAKGFKDRDMASLECWAAWWHRMLMGPIIPKASMMALEGGRMAYVSEEITPFERLEDALIRLRSKGLVALLNTPHNRQLFAEAMVASAYLGNSDASSSNMCFTGEPGAERLVIFDYDLTLYETHSRGSIDLGYPGQYALKRVDDITFGYRPAAFYYRDPRGRTKSIDRAIEIMNAVQVILHAHATGNRMPVIHNFQLYHSLFENYRRYLEEEHRSFTPEEQEALRLPPIRPLDEKSDGFSDLVRVAQKIQSFGFFPMRLVPDGHPSNPNWLDRVRRVMQAEALEKSEGKLDYTLQDAGYEAWLKCLAFPPDLFEALAENILTTRANAHVMNYLQHRRSELFQALCQSQGFRTFLRTHGNRALERIQTHYLGLWQDKYIRHLFRDDARVFQRSILLQVSFGFITASMEEEFRQLEMQELERAAEEGRRYSDAIAAAAAVQAAREAAAARQQEQGIRIAREWRIVSEWNKGIHAWLDHYLSIEIKDRSKDDTKRKLFEAVGEILKSAEWERLMDRLEAPGVRLNRWIPLFRLMTCISCHQRWARWGTTLFKAAAGANRLDQHLPKGESPWELFIQQMVEAAKAAPSAEWFSALYERWRRDDPDTLRNYFERSVMREEDPDYWQLPNEFIEKFVNVHLELPSFAAGRSVMGFLR